MFQVAQSLGTPLIPVPLYTTKGTPIETFVECEATEHDERKFDLVVLKHGKNWIIRKRPTGRYNCAGHVFACRRASILSSSDWVTILSDDGYHDFENPACVNPGDLVAYTDRESGDIYHFAEIVRLDQFMENSRDSRLMALSKWDSTSGEVLHNVYETPYDLHRDVRIVFWTDRRPPLKENASEFWCTRRITVGGS